MGVRYFRAKKNQIIIILTTNCDDHCLLRDSACAERKRFEERLDNLNVATFRCLLHSKHLNDLIILYYFPTGATCQCKTSPVYKIIKFKFKILNFHLLSTKLPHPSSVKGKIGKRLNRQFLPTNLNTSDCPMASSAEDKPTGDVNANLMRREQWLREKYSLLFPDAFKNSTTQHQLSIAYSDLNLSHDQLKHLLSTFVTAAQTHLDSKLDSWLQENDIPQMCHQMDVRHSHDVIANTVDNDILQNLPIQDRASLPTPQTDLPQRTLDRISSQCQGDTIKSLQKLIAQRQETLTALKNQVSEDLQTMRQRSAHLNKLSSSHSSP